MQLFRVLGFGQRDDVADTVEHRAGTVGVFVERRLRGDAGEDEHGGHAAFHAGDNVRIHPVADHDGLGAVAAETLESGAHHQRVRLADIVCGLAGGQLNRRNQCAACRNNALLGRAGQVGVGRNQARALACPLYQSDAAHE